jgi:hypothetical protein
MRGCGTLVAARASFMALVIGLLWTPGVAFSAKSPAPSPNHTFAYETSGVVNIGVDPSSVSGPDTLRFQGITNAKFDPKVPQTLNIGQFVVVPSSIVPGTTTTYTNTPFEVEIQTPEFNKINTVPVLDNLLPSLGKNLDLKTVTENSLLLTGHLDGTIGPNGQVNVTATVDSIKLGSLDAPSQDNVTHYTFPIRYNQLNLPASWVMSATASSLTTSPSTMPTPSTAATTSATTNIAPAPAAEMLITTPTTTTPTIAPPPAAEMLITAPIATPEPSTIVFFAVALGSLVLGRRRLLPR